MKQLLEAKQCPPTPTEDLISAVQRAAKIWFRIISQNALGCARCKRHPRTFAFVLLFPMMPLGVLAVNNT